MDYTLLTDEQKVFMLKERLLNYEALHYEAELELKAAQATGLDLEGFAKKVEQFSICIDATNAELARF